MFADKQKRKVSIIGAGAVGSGIAYALMLRGLTQEIVLIDINEKLANAEMLDIRHGLHCMPFSNISCGEYSDIKDSSLIIVTAGRSRNQGESRLDLAGDNLKIMSDIASNIEKYYNGGVVLVVSNPVDVLTYYLTKRLNLPHGKVFGTGCILDTSRLSSIVSDYLGQEVEIPVIGEHGNSQTAFWSAIGDCGLNESQKTAMEADVRAMGAEIIAGKGKTFYGIATCVCCIAEAIIGNRPAKLSVSTLLNGEYGIKDAALSVPCTVDADGARVLADINFSEKELAFLKETARNLKIAEIKNGLN